MTVAARRELALRTAVRYKNAARPEKKRILDEFLESTGFHRKHATRLLNDTLRGERPRREPRGRIRRYGPAVQAALIAAWRTVNYVCGKRVVRFYVNFFQPSMKLTTKTRDGSQVTKRYDIAQTPYQRLSNSDARGPEARDRLAAIYERSDPVDLRRQLEKLQDAFWRHAKELASPTLTDDIVPAALVSPNCGADADRAPIEAELPEPGFEERITRLYRKTRKQRVPHTWRTRPDPFDGVREEMRSWLESDPGRTSRSLLLERQQRRPGRYPNGQLRTLQRRVREWRRQNSGDFRWRVARTGSGPPGFNICGRRGLWNRRTLRDLGKLFAFPTFPQPRRREELSRLTSLSVTFSMRQPTGFR